MIKDNKPGFVAIFRKIQDHWLWNEKPYHRAMAWIDILLSAQFHDSKVVVGGQVINVPRGTWFVSIKTLETRWGWSRNKVRTFIRTLERDGMVHAEGTARGMLLTVVKYEDYQSAGTAKGTAKGTTEGTAEGIAGGTAEGTSEGTHTNKGNKGNKGNKIDEAFLSKCTYTKEEGDSYASQVKEGKKPFPNAATEDEYWKRELEERRKDW